MTTATTRTEIKEAHEMGIITDVERINLIINLRADKVRFNKLSE